MRGVCVDGSFATRLNKLLEKNAGVLRLHYYHMTLIFSVCLWLLMVWGRKSPVPHHRPAKENWRRLGIIKCMICGFSLQTYQLMSMGYGEVFWYVIGYHSTKWNVGQRRGSFSSLCGVWYHSGDYLTKIDRASTRLDDYNPYRTLTIDSNLD